MCIKVPVPLILLILMIIVEMRNKKVVYHIFFIKSLCNYLFCLHDTSPRSTAVIYNFIYRFRASILIKSFRIERPLPYWMESSNYLHSYVINRSYTFSLGITNYTVLTSKSINSFTTPSNFSSSAIVISSSFSV